MTGRPAERHCGRRWLHRLGWGYCGEWSIFFFFFLVFLVGKELKWASSIGVCDWSRGWFISRACWCWMDPSIGQMVITRDMHDAVMEMCTCCALLIIVNNRGNRVRAPSNIGTYNIYAQSPSSLCGLWINMFSAVNKNVPLRRNIMLCTVGPKMLSRICSIREN